MSSPNHLDFSVVGHARLLEILPKHAVDQAHSREVLHPTEPHLFQLLQEIGHDTEWIRATDAGQNPGVLNYGEHFVGLISRQNQHPDVLGEMEYLRSLAISKTTALASP